MNLRDEAPSRNFMDRTGERLALMMERARRMPMLRRGMTPEEHATAMLEVLLLEKQMEFQKFDDNMMMRGQPGYLTPRGGIPR